MFSPSSFNPLTIALLGVIASIIAYQAGGQRPEAPRAAGPVVPRPIAVFDLERTFNALSEKTAEENRLVEVAKAMKVDADAMSKAVNRQQEDLKELKPDTPQYQAALLQAAEAAGDYKAKVDFNRAKLDIEKARMMLYLYKQIREAARQMAQERGYAIVFVDDSKAAIPPGTEEETNRQISARRMVYTSPEIDITDELISRMNNAFNMAGPAPAGGNRH